MIESSHKIFRAKNLPFSLLIQTRSLVAIIALFAFLLTLMLVSLSSGSNDITFYRMIITLKGEGTPIENFSVMTLRLPRILLGSLVGVGFALSGAILQGLIRNPLASPDIIGINSGASLMAVIFITLLHDYFDIAFLPLFAFSGALITSLVLYLLAWKKGVTPFRLILIGFGISSLLGAFQTMLMLSGDLARVGLAYKWLTGSLHATSWSDVKIVFIWMLILIPSLIFFIKALNLQQVSDEITINLGGRVQSIRIGLIIIAACLSGVSVSFAGGMSFVGLISPHIARKLVGTSYGQLLPCSALIGAILVVFSDWIGRTFFSPLDIAAGVFISLIGAPFFLYLFVMMDKK